MIRSPYTPYIPIFYVLEKDYTSLFHERLSVSGCTIDHGPHAVLEQALGGGTLRGRAVCFRDSTAQDSCCSDDLGRARLFAGAI